MAWRNLDNPWRRAPLALALEPRIMFDAAGAATYADLGDPDPTPVPPPGDEAPREIVFVDRAVAAHDHLVAHVREGVEIVVLSTETDALDQIAAALQGRSDLAAIHIVSHGSEGQLILGGRAFDAAALSARADTLAAIGAALAQDGDILLYGCEIARGDDGLAFLGTLASLTGADIAASIDHTGNAAFGGNWTLEAQVGAVSASLAFTIEGQGEYGFLLAASYTLGDTTGFPAPAAAGRMLVADFDGDGDVDILFQTGGNGTAFNFARNNGGTFTILAQSASPFAGLSLPDHTGTNYFIGDFNGDGRIDVLVGQNSSTSVYFRNDGSSFSQQSTSGWPAPLVGARQVVGDFTGNGFTDILFQVGGNGTAWNFAQNNGDGTFSMAQFYFGVDMASERSVSAEMPGRRDARSQPA